MALMMVVFLFPANTNPGPQTMNYATVVFCMFYSPPMAWPFFTLHSIGGVLFLATVYFYFPKYGARYWFEGPIRTIGDLDDLGKANTITDEKAEKQAF
jgi:hypothetical protein